MPKTRANLVIEEELLNRVRQTADRMRWTLTAATELAFELFLKEFEKAQLPGFPTPIESTSIEEVTAV